MGYAVLVDVGFWSFENWKLKIGGNLETHRIYKAPIRELYPTIYHAKAMMKRLKKDRPVLLYCD